MPPNNPHRARLGARLGMLCADAFRYHADLGRHLRDRYPGSRWDTPRVSQRVSRIISGHQVPSHFDLDTWVAATGASPTVRAELGELRTFAIIDYAQWSDLYKAGSPGAIAAQRSGVTERETAPLRAYQPAMIPGPLQTVAYMREMFTACAPHLFPNLTPDALNTLIAGRVERQTLLYQPGYRAQLIIGESALHIHFGRPETLLGQLVQLVFFAGLPSVDLRVIPYSAAHPVMPLTGFRLIGDSVRIETFVGEQTLTAPEDIASYGKVFEALRVTSLGGDSARELIQRTAGELSAALAHAPLGRKR